VDKSTKFGLKEEGNFFYFLFFFIFFGAGSNSTRIGGAGPARSPVQTSDPVGWTAARMRELFTHACCTSHSAMQAQRRQENGGKKLTRFRGRGLLLEDEGNIRRQVIIIQRCTVLVN
jgi:hypothetical protein